MKTRDEFKEGLDFYTPKIGGKNAWLLCMSQTKLSNHATFLTPFDIPVDANEEIESAMISTAQKAFPAGVALRTSPTHSMPGILQSYFNLKTVEEIKNALSEAKETWNEKISQMWRNKFCPDAKLAFCLQECIEAEIYGVFFTHNPVTGHKENHVSWSSVRGGTVRGQKSLGFEELSVLQQSTLEKFSTEALDFIGLPLDIEFGFIGDKLYIFQARLLKLSTQSRLQAVSTFILASKMTWKEASKLFTKDELLHARRNNSTVSINEDYLANGVAASSGVVTGKVNIGKGKGGILFVKELDGKNENELFDSVALISSESSNESHGAIRARERKIPAIVEIPFRIENDCVIFTDGTKLYENETVTIDGTIGRIYKGKIKRIHNIEIEIAAELLHCIK